MDDPATLAAVGQFALGFISLVWAANAWWAGKTKDMP